MTGLVSTFPNLTYNQMNCPKFLYKKKIASLDWIPYLTHNSIYAKIGIIGDIHAEHEQLDAAIRQLESMAVQVILCAGDIVDGNGDADKCCQLLDQHGVLTVRGNHDNWMVDGHNSITPLEQLSEFSRNYITALPATRDILTALGNLLLCHGIGTHDMKRITPDDYGYALESNFELQEVVFSEKYTFMVNGHTHQRMARKFNQMTIINGGSLISGHQPCVTMLDTEAGTVRFFDLSKKSSDNLLKTVELSKIQAEPLRKSFF
jgi:putative phosphoesterase